MASERAYVLGTNDEELARLGVQHRAWRERALAAWRFAGIKPGDTENRRDLSTATTRPEEPTSSAISAEA
jgi:hypothetical protein